MLEGNDILNFSKDRKLETQLLNFHEHFNFQMLISPNAKIADRTFLHNSDDMGHIPTFITIGPEPIEGTVELLLGCNDVVPPKDAPMSPLVTPL